MPNKCAIKIHMFSHGNGDDETHTGTENMLHVINQDLPSLMNAALQSGEPSASPGI